MNPHDLIQTAEWLLETANISPEMERRIRSALYQFERDRLARCVEWLRANQHEPGNPAKQCWQRWRLHNFGL